MRCADLLLLAALLLPDRAAALAKRVDIALVLAVDVSGSVDPMRFALQMRGIARALEDPGIQASMLSGSHGAVLISLVQWANRPTLSVPWTLVTSPEDARRLAANLRRTPRVENGFTCMSVALRSIADKLLLQLPIPAERLVVDVSGDGRDNCNRAPVDGVRDELAAAGVVVNGLPILEGDEADTLEAWYRDHVIGGPGAFLVPAQGYADVERAMRHKFSTEVSLGPPARTPSAARTVCCRKMCPRTRVGRLPSGDPNASAAPAPPRPDLPPGEARWCKAPVARSAIAAETHRVTFPNRLGRHIADVFISFDLGDDL